MKSAKGAGFTLIELLITVAIVGLLASIALPLAEVTVQRNKERDLRVALRDMREAIDAYKRASDEGRIEKKADRSGYPPTLNALVEGAKDISSPEGKSIFFLRRIPQDSVSGRDWGVRSYASTADNPQPGQDVFDVHSQAEGAGLNGRPYKEW